MFKKRLLLTLTLLGIVLASLVTSSYTFRVSSSNGTRSVQAPSALHLDCFRREYHFSKSSSLIEDASNYFIDLI